MKESYPVRTRFEPVYVMRLPLEITSCMSSLSYTSSGYWSGAVVLRVAAPRILHHHPCMTTAGHKVANIVFHFRRVSKIESPRHARVSFPRKGQTLTPDILRSPCNFLFPTTNVSIDEVFSLNIGRLCWFAPLHRLANSHSNSVPFHFPQRQNVSGELNLH